MNLLDRIASILLRPGTEWPVIAGEDTAPATLLRRYILPLAAIGPVATFIGFSVVGQDVPLLGQLRMPVFSGIATALASYLLGLAGIFLFAIIVDRLAPNFGGSRDLRRALRLVAYSFTPAWLAAALLVLPVLAVPALLISLYGFYLLYRGLPVLMGSRSDKALPYAVVSVLCAVLIQGAIGIASGAVAGMAGRAVLGAAPVADAEGGLSQEQREALAGLKALGEQLNEAQAAIAADAAPVAPVLELSAEQQVELERLRAIGESLNRQMGERPDGG